MPTKQVSVVLSNADPKNRVVKFTESSNDDYLRNAYIGNAAMKKLGNPDEVEIIIRAKGSE